MLNFTRVCHVPAIDSRTGKFVVKNFIRNKTNVNLKFYNQAGMYAGELGDDYHQWGDVHLKCSDNICPECGAFTMSFEMLGCYD